MDYKRNNGKVISSSKKIADNNDNPPHYQAKEEYLKKLSKSSDFLNTAIEPTEKNPEPIVFEISSTGIVRAKSKNEKDIEKINAAASVAATSIIKKPWCY